MNHNSLNVTVKFKQLVMGAPVTIVTANQLIGVTGGSATIDTGWKNIAAPAAGGSKYYIEITGSTVPPVGGAKVNLPPTPSPTITFMP